MTAAVSSGGEPTSVFTNLERAAEWLRTAERPVCLAGRGAVWSGASQTLLELCARVPKLRVVSTPGAKGVFPEQHPQARGVWGFSGHAAAFDAVSKSDVLLVVGSRLLEQSSGEWHPRLHGPHVVRVDLEATRLSGNSAQCIALSGDALAVLAAINQRLALSAAPITLARAAPAGGSAIARFDRPFDEDCLVKPQGLFAVLNRVAAEVPVCADAGHAMCWAIEWLERSQPRNFQVSLDWGTMGFALPAAIGMSLARQARPVIAVTGDGSMAMAGGDLHTAVELELPIIVVVLNDGGPGMVRAGSRAWFGPNAVPDPDYRYKINLAAYARGFGAHAELVTSCADFESQLQRALARPTPSLFDVQVDPAEVPAAIHQRIQGLAAGNNGATPVQGGGMC